MAKKILIIEDESALQRALAHILKGEKYDIVTASDGEKGIELAQSEKPDLVLLDLVLPKKDGFEVLTELKKNSSTKYIPVIILSNLENNEDVEKALAGGATTYLVKTNYKLTEVIEKIRGQLK